MLVVDCFTYSGSDHICCCWLTALLTLGVVTDVVDWLLYLL